MDDAREKAEPRPRRATSTDVARESGVSRATVSYVLNNTPGHSISAATRALVLETAERLGHIPNGPARALRSGHMKLVLAIVPGFTIGYIFDLIIERLHRELGARGYALLVTRLNDAEEGFKLRELWGTVSPAVVLAMGGLPDHSRKLVDVTRTPLVEDVGILSHEEIGRIQARYLTDLGHTRLGFAFPSDRTIERYATRRLAGVREICRERGIEPPLVRVFDSRLEEAREAVEDFRAAGITALCCHNDELALMVLPAMSELELVPGTDLAVIGVDDVPLAAMGLTTVAIALDALAAATVDHVIAVLDGRDPEPVAEPLLQLVIRTSA